MAASQGYKSETEALRAAKGLRTDYLHVEVDDRAGEIVVWYCCSRDERLAAVELRYGYWCRVAGWRGPASDKHSL